MEPPVEYIHLLNTQLNTNKENTKSIYFSSAFICCVSHLFLPNEAHVLWWLYYVRCACENKNKYFWLIELNHGLCLQLVFFLIFKRRKKRHVSYVTSKAWLVVQQFCEEKKSQHVVYPCLLWLKNKTPKTMQLSFYWERQIVWWENVFVAVRLKYTAAVTVTVIKSITY